MGVTLRSAIVVVALLACAEAQRPSELRFAIRTDPKTFDPLRAAEEASETIRYLTAGVLIRLDRVTQKLHPELAESWKVSDGGRRIDFTLRPGVRFSDGSPFGPEDVIATIRRVSDPELHSAIGDSFRSNGGEIRAARNGASGVSVTFSKPVAGMELLFDELAISPARAEASTAVLGPFVVAEYKSGQYVQLRRNPHYWKTDERGGRLPRLDGLRLDIQANRETELLRFRRGEFQLLDKLEPEAFERLAKDLPRSARNAGPSLDVEVVWFNQVPGAPVPAHKLRWFQSRAFRQAVSASINRADMVRLAYRGYAQPAAGPVSRANKTWFNERLTPPRFDPDAALRLLRGDGFRLDGTTLRDSGGRPVEFSLITNAGSRTRSAMASIMQQDLSKIGIRVNFTPLEFQSLIERITRTNQYEACLLGYTNVEIDPNGQANIWMSSGTHHAWNPGQAAPATPWEAEIDRLIQRQASATTVGERKEALDRVQEILAEQQPMLYLVHPDVLVAVSDRVRNAAPSALPPHLLWNIEYLSLAPAGR